MTQGFVISDSPTQAQVLASNAAIQATMVAKAGGGSAVVADEVQCLAELPPTWLEV